MSTETSEPLVVFLTAATADEAAAIADALVTNRLAACVQILPPMQSVYVWQGKVERAEEVMLLAKTTRDNFSSLERAVRAIHSYETPEIIGVPIVEGSDDYLKWLLDCSPG